MAKKKISSEIKMVSLGELKPHPKNPNIHPKAQIEALVASMEKYGQYYPIIVDEDMQILAGHGKKLALEERGDTKGEVRILSGLSEKQKLKLLIEDNKIQTMSYMTISDVDEVIKEIGEFDIIGFSPDYIGTIMEEIEVGDALLDNTGVSLDTGGGASTGSGSTEPIKKEKAFTDEEETDAVKAFAEIEKGAQKAAIRKCPHCGKPLTI